MQNTSLQQLLEYTHTQITNRSVSGLLSFANVVSKDYEKIAFSLRAVLLLVMKMAMNHLRSNQLFIKEKLRDIYHSLCHVFHVNGQDIFWPKMRFFVSADSLSLKGKQPIQSNPSVIIQNVQNTIFRIVCQEHFALFY